MAKTADYDLGEFTFPRGWFMIARADEVSKKPLNLRYFGQDMVLYRGDSGRLVLMDAYCPHMGTHIGQNETSYVVMDNEHVDGDNIRCPYHGWQFGPDGKCIEIPYSSRRRITCIAITKPSTATVFPLRFRLHYKTARVGGVSST